MNILTYIKDFFDLIYPRTCSCCNRTLGNQENEICTICAYELPRTNFHKSDDNPVAQCFWGRVSVHKATAYFLFNKGSKYQQLLHKLKYHHRPQIGIELGKMFGCELVKDKVFADNIDYIIPVPLHKKKLKKRGYNQSEVIAKGLAEFIHAEVNTTLLQRIYFTETQTKKNRHDRWQNVKNVFECKPIEKANAHILIVDDVITTGATLEACANAILQTNPNVTISIVALAFAEV